MSVTINSIYTDRTVVISRAVLGHINVALPVGPDVNVSRAEFLAAVEAECGVRLVPADSIVIDRADVPEVYVNPTFIVEEPRPDDRPYASIALPTESSAEDFRRLGIGFIALAEYLDAHPPTPPVDEADVEALAGDMLSAYNAGADLWHGVARCLLATGKITVTL